VQIIKSEYRIVKEPLKEIETDAKAITIWVVATDKEIEETISTYFRLFIEKQIIKIATR
jgi:hypothetical protein